ncbi:MAG: diaminopimelate epimerase [Sediminibacterium sp.]
MHGIGNDYIYVDCFSRGLTLDNPSSLSIAWSNRNFRIGADGLILIMASKIADFKMQMFNADGSEGKMCGNGIRCVGKYVYDKKLSNKENITIETLAGIKTLDLYIEHGVVKTVRVDMGEPLLDTEKIPVNFHKHKVINETLLPEILNSPATCVSMGNPHVVFFVKRMTDKIVQNIGRRIHRHPIFPEKTNVEMIKVLNRKEIQMRVWERGSGETLACGTGACAAMVAARLNDLVDDTVTVHLLGGDLKIHWAPDNHVYMTGPAEFSFEGSIGHTMG